MSVPLTISIHSVMFNATATVCGIPLGGLRSREWTQDTRLASCRDCLGALPPLSRDPEMVEEWLDR